MFDFIIADSFNDLGFFQFHTNNNQSLTTMSKQKIDIFKKNNKVSRQFTDALKYAINQTDIKKFFEENVERKRIISRQSIEFGQEIYSFLKKTIKKIDDSLMDEEWSNDSDDKNVESDETLESLNDNAKFEKCLRQKESTSNLADTLLVPTKKKHLGDSGPSIVPIISSTKLNHKNKKYRGDVSDEDCDGNETCNNRSSDSSPERELSSSPKRKKRTRISEDMKLKILNIYKCNTRIKLQALKDKSGFQGFQSIQQVKLWETQLNKQKNYTSNPEIQITINNWVRCKCVEFISKNGATIISDEEIKEWGSEAKENLLSLGHSVSEFKPTNNWVQQFKQIFQPVDNNGKTGVNKCISQEELRGKFNNYLLNIF